MYEILSSDNKENRNQETTHNIMRNEYVLRIEPKRSCRLISIILNNFQRTHTWMLDIEGKIYVVSPYILLCGRTKRGGRRDRQQTSVILTSRNFRQMWTSCGLLTVHRKRLLMFSVETLLRSLCYVQIIYLNEK